MEKILHISYGFPLIFPSKPPFSAGILPLLTLFDLRDLLDAEADLLGRLVLAGLSGHSNQPT